MPKKEAVNKFWKFVNINDEETELQLYSDIADSKSTNWFSGEEGDEVTPKSFKEELNAVLSNNICVRINSNGGSVFAAAAIASNLKELQAKGKKVTCKIDGICASAAVIVALSCSHISIANGAYMMIHKPFNFMYGYYNADDMEKASNALNKIQQGIVEAYIERTGLSEKECNKLIDKETWFTAKEAVENGFADEILYVTPDDKDDDTEVMNNIRSAFVASACVADYKQVPKALKEAFENKKTVKEGESHMEVKNYEDLKTAYPELVSNAENKARDEGVEAGAKSERERIKEIDNLAGKIDNATLNAAKYGDVKMTADEVIVKAFKENKMLNSGYLNAAKEDTETCNEVEGDGIEEDGKKKDEKDEEEAKNFLINTAKNCRNGGKR